MHLIIPMSGEGSRFKKAGYAELKPLIKINGREILKYVVDLYPGVSRITLICNQEHIKKHNIEDRVRQISPRSEIEFIPAHKKGPVWAVLEANINIDTDEEIIVSYCDFCCYWDFNRFREWVTQERPDGCIPAYRGFHPHSLGSTNYAYLKEESGRVYDIREKRPFTNEKMDEYASTGTYYFRNGRLMKRWFEQAVREDLSVKGEFYASLPFKIGIAEGKDIRVYEVEHFMQWGTPEDLEEYLEWSSIFDKFNDSKDSVEDLDCVKLMCMAGAGNRFEAEGFDVPKPYIKAVNKPMFRLADSFLPNCKKSIYAVQGEHFRNNIYSQSLSTDPTKDTVAIIDGIKQGQALSSREALKDVDEELELKPLLITACDHGMIYSKSDYIELFSNDGWDIIVWSSKSTRASQIHPDMYGWISSCDGMVNNVSVKKALQDPKSDRLIIGTFTFRSVRLFNALCEGLVRDKFLVNGEYYIDSIISMAISRGLIVKEFKIDHYIGMGTPAELRTFLYWEECFNKWGAHEYARRVETY